MGGIGLSPALSMEGYPKDQYSGYYYLILLSMTWKIKNGSNLTTHLKTALPQGDPRRTTVVVRGIGMEGILWNATVAALEGTSGGLLRLAGVRETPHLQDGAAVWT